MERRLGEFARTRASLETGKHASWVRDVLVSTSHAIGIANARKLAPLMFAMLRTGAMCEPLRNSAGIVAR